jgi:hypothetical protein
MHSIANLLRQPAPLADRDRAECPRDRGRPSRRLHKPHLSASILSPKSAPSLPRCAHLWLSPPIPLVASIFEWANGGRASHISARKLHRVPFCTPAHSDWLLCHQVLMLSFAVAKLPDLLLATPGDFIHRDGCTSRQSLEMVPTIAVAAR